MTTHTPPYMGLPTAERIFMLENDILILKAKFKNRKKASADALEDLMWLIEHSEPWELEHIKETPAWKNAVAALKQVRTK